MEQVHHGFGLKNLLLIVVVASVLLLSYLFQKEARLAYLEKQKNKTEGQVLGSSIVNYDFPFDCLFQPAQVETPPRASDPSNPC
jgi:hypothetical protein